VRDKGIELTGGLVVFVPLSLHADPDLPGDVPDAVTPQKLV